MEHFKLRLAASHMIAPSVRHLAFEREDGAPFAFVPGQFIQIHFHYDDGKPTKRSYSVGTVGDGSGSVQRLEIAVSYVEGGAATALLSQLDEGGTVDASGPFGRFCLMDADTNARYLFVATGTGVTPFRAMLPKIRELVATRGCTFALVYGARSEAVALRRRVRSLRARSTRFLLPSLLQPRAACGTASARSQRPRAGCTRRTAPNAATDIAYLCGNPDMVDESFAMLKAAGLGVPQIRREIHLFALSAPPGL
jgi:ferredoxin-NADP reductase